MKALVLEKPGHLRYMDVADPEPPAPDWVLLRVAAAGVCGSDIPRVFDGRAYHYPIVLGHEFSAVVERSPVSAFDAGDRVAVFPLIPCGTCPSCQAGYPAQCDHYDYLGSRRDGAFAELVYAPPASLYPIPDHVDTYRAAFAEPAAVALHGINKLTVRPGTVAAVYGAGPVGNLAAQWLRLRGSRTVYCVDVDERKLAIAQAMGFRPVNPQQEDPVARVHGETDDRGADVAVEAVGLPLTFRQTLQTVSKRGQVLFMGNIHGDFQLPEAEFSAILRKELTIFGTWNSDVVPPFHNDWTVVLDHLDQDIQVEPLMSHVAPLSDGEALFQIIHGRREPVVKALFAVGPRSRP
jgi:L-iditol 2-dehydrogenase/galactitol-1-phosphate 5-dehydrogenase